MSRFSPSRLAVLVVVGVVAVQALMLLAFSWTASNTEPRELPVGVAGPPEVADQIAAGLGERRSDDGDTAAFDVLTFEDRAAAELAIRERDAYGAIVATPEGPELLVASGAGPAVAQLLQRGAAELNDGDAPPVEDIVPTDPDDPNGAALASGVLPLVMTSAAGGAIAAIAVRGGWRRVTTVLALAIGGGFAATALLQYVVGAVDGPYFQLSATIALVVGAIAAGVAGLGALGRAGIGLGMLLLIFVGNPLSAATSAPEMLPQPLGEIGQFLPPGAGVSAVRSVAFFDNEALLQPAIVLGAWLVGGLLLILIGSAIRNRMDYDLDDDIDVAEPAHAI